MIILRRRLSIVELHNIHIGLRVLYLYTFVATCTVFIIFRSACYTEGGNPLAIGDLLYVLPVIQRIYKRRTRGALSRGTLSFTNNLFFIFAPCNRTLLCTS